MKLLRYGPIGEEVPAILADDGSIRDVSAHCFDFMCETVSIENIKAISELDPSSLPELPADGRIGCPLADVPNFFCIGLNYARHAAETGAKVPPEPMLFNKATSALSGPYDDLALPNGSTHTDWETELGIVIGVECENVSEDDALSVISAYFTANDFSERHWQNNLGGQFVKGKSAPGFGAIGPYLVTPDEVADPQNLNLWTKVNGEKMQNSNTSDMIFNVKTIISKLSHHFRLRVGDIIITGTPEGVGLGMKPPQFLKAGDVVEVEVEGLGAQRKLIT